MFENASERVRLERWAPEAVIDLPGDHGGIELFVLDGSFNEAGEEFTVHSWLRLPASSRLRARAGREGCTIWVKSGHLARDLRLPTAAAMG